MQMGEGKNKNVMAWRRRTQFLSLFARRYLPINVSIYSVSLFVSSYFFVIH